MEVKLQGGGSFLIFWLSQESHVHVPYCHARYGWSGISDEGIRVSRSGRVWVSAARIRIQGWLTETLREFKVMSIFKHVGTKRYCGGITLSLPRHYPCITSAFHESIRNHFTLLEKSSHSCLALFKYYEIFFPDWKRATWSKAGCGVGWWRGVGGRVGISSN